MDFLSLGWQGLRFCSLWGSLCRSLVPTRFIPQGDPSSPCVLANVLRPWHASIQLRHPQVLCWAYVDDCSLKSCCPFQLNAALATIQDFDSAVGLKETTAKRQLCSVNGGTPVEHLGLLAITPFPISYLLFVMVGLLCWKFYLCWLACLLAWSFVKLLCTPSSKVNGVGLFLSWNARPLTSSLPNWWCPGCFWADRVDLHPVLSCALGIVPHGLPSPSSRLLDAVHDHLDRLGLQIASWSAVAVTVRLRSVGGLLGNLYTPLRFVSYSDPDQAF